MSADSCLRYPGQWNLDKTRDKKTDEHHYVFKVPVKPDTEPRQALEAMAVLISHILANGPPDAG